MTIRVALALGVLAAVSGCTSIGSAPPDSGVTTVTPAAPASAEATTLATMLERARADRLAGRLSEAEATLEAALRIAPDDARLWLELAELQFAAGDFEAARNLAERAVALSGGSRDVVEAARRLRAQIGE